MTIRSALAATLALPLWGGGPAAAATILGDGFDFGFSVGGVAQVEEFPPDVQPTAGGGNASGSDYTPFYGNGSSFMITWVDEDSVDVSFFGGFDGDAIDIAYTFSDLDFTQGGQSLPIEGVVFNREDSDIDGFLGDEGQPPESAFVEPLLTFTDTSFTASFSFFDGRLVGDGPRLRYDVVVAPIPLPAGLPLLAGALGLLALVRRRRHRDD